MQALRNPTPMNGAAFSSATCVVPDVRFRGKQVSDWHSEDPIEALAVQGVQQKKGQYIFFSQQQGCPLKWKQELVELA